MATQGLNKVSRQTSGQSWRLSAAALMLSAAFLATGCATTATGAKQSSIVGLTSSPSLQSQAPAGSALAVIRYPAVVDASAKDAYYRAFETAVIGGAVSRGGGASEVEGIADSVIVKSNYYALSLFKEMAARLPEHTVLLSPHTVKLDASGQLTSEPITKAESLPSVVSVDFATYSYPDLERMMKSEPLTFGDLVTPLVSVRTDHLASAPTQGVLFASAPLIPYAAGNGRVDSDKAITTLQRGQFETDVPELDFISYISRGERLNVAASSLRSGYNENFVTAYPVEKIKLDGVALSQLDTASNGSVDPLERVFSDAMADQIIHIINNTDSQRAVMATKAAAISTYDPSLAALTFVGSDEADYNARLRYAERLLDAERKYLSVQSLRIFDGVHNGEMGAQMRDIILAEYDVIQERRRLARKQNQAAAFAVLGAVAAGAAIANGPSGRDCTTIECQQRAQNTNIGNGILTQLAIQGAIVATQEAFSLNARSKAIGRNYSSSIMPALQQQTSVTVDLLDSSETITAIRFEDLKSKLQGLYSSRQRSLDTVATRCGFNTGSGTVGTWLGACEGGQANGTGVGVLQNSDGTSVEYYGYARAGVPNGSGLMLIHSAASSQALEGNFVNGKAEGPIRVSSAGKSDTIRSYSAGQDIGSSSSLPASPFNLSVAR